VNPTLLLRWALRESRGARGRLAALTACLALGVAAVVAVTGAVDSLQQGMAGKTRDLLGADLVVENRAPFPPELDALLAEAVPDARRTDIIEMRSMAAAPGVGGDLGRSSLVELKVLGGPFPFYGEVTLDPPGALHEVLDEDSAAVAPALLSALGLAPGDDVLIGGALFTVVAQVMAEPDRLGISFTLGPRVFITSAGFERTDLAAFGNRVEYKAMLAVTPDVDVRAVESRLRTELERPGLVRDVDSGADSQPGVSRQLERVERTLGLMALLSLVLGGIGVSQVVRAWLGARTASVAVMRCLGMRPAEILVMFLGQVVVLASVGCVLGAAAGAIVPWLLPSLLPDVVPADLVHAFQPMAWLRGIGLGLGLALVFALPPLTAVWRVAPAKVLRAEAAPLPAPRGVSVLCFGALLLGVFGSAWALGDRPDLAGWFTLGLAVAALVLTGAARGVMWAVGRLPREKVGPTFRHGLAALARPGAGTTGAVTALGLGVFVVLSVAVVAERLSHSLRTALPEDAPTAFLVDVQPDQWEPLSAELEARAPGSVRSTPVVMARLAEIDGKRVADLIAGHERRGERDDAGRGGGGDGPRADGDQRDGRGDGRSRWVFTREQRLTWMEVLGEDNQIIDGELWSHPGVDELSLEEGFAETLGAKVGTELVFDVQGVPVPLTVTSIRTVEWRSFAINFFLVAEPGVLDDAPHFRIATTRLTPEAQREVQDVVAARFPNVTLMDVRAILEKVAELLTMLATGIGALGLLTVITGLAVLAGSVASTSLRRGREAALLKTLGVTRKGVVRLFAIEHALLGAVAGAVGGVAGMLLADGFLREVAELVVDMPWVAVPVAAVLAGVLSAVCGIAACRGALRQPPLLSLRG
jgi:putative ABC transport system permease protein